ncbi:hypothetical protein scyTo_0024292, partial [Scyliorhinus torazame]|nr:hypothetical protein [Scyliorhinus torazame]
CTAPWKIHPIIELSMCWLAPGQGVGGDPRAGRLYAHSASRQRRNWKQEPRSEFTVKAFLSSSF